MGVGAQEGLLRQVSHISWRADARPDKIRDSAFIAFHKQGEGFAVAGEHEGHEPFVGLFDGGHPFLTVGVLLQIPASRAKVPRGAQREEHGVKHVLVTGGGGYIGL